MLAVDGLTKDFDGFLAVKNVSFEVAEGEILGLIGPNGSGKSTTFNLIAGALKPTAGSVRFRGAEIGGLPAYRVAHAGIGRTHQIPKPFRSPPSMARTKASRATRHTAERRKRSPSSAFPLRKCKTSAPPA